MQLILFCTRRATAIGTHVKHLYGSDKQTLAFCSSARPAARDTSGQARLSELIFLALVQLYKLWAVQYPRALTEGGGHVMAAGVMVAGSGASAKMMMRRLLPPPTYDIPPTRLINFTVRQYPCLAQTRLSISNSGLFLSMQNLAAHYQAQVETLSWQPV